MQYDFTKVTAIYGTADYNTGPTVGYAVRDRHDRNRHLGYVAKVGNDWQAVRPKQFGTFGAFHTERRNLHGAFATRTAAADYLRRLAQSCPDGTCQHPTVHTSVDCYARYMDLEYEGPQAWASGHVMTRSEWERN